MKEYSRKLTVIEKNGAIPTNGQSNSNCKTNLWEFKKENKRRIFCTYWLQYKNIQGKIIKKNKNHLINKFEILKNSTGEKSKQKITSNIKQAVINLTNTKLTEEQKSLLNLGPNFVPATKRMPFMDIILAAETSRRDSEERIKETDAEFLFLNRKLNIKLLDNLSKPQRQSLVQMKSNKDTIIYTFYKGWIELFRIIWAFIWNGVPMVYTIVLMGKFFFDLWTFIVPYNRGGIGSDGYIWKYFLYVNSA